TMNEAFFQQLYHKQRKIANVPPNGVIADWALHVLDLLFPERKTHPDGDIEQLKMQFDQSEADLLGILDRTKACETCNHKEVTRRFYGALPELYRVLHTDAVAIFEGDPAATSNFEVIRTYPGFLAIALYCLAHTLMDLEVPLIPRILTEYAHSQTGIDMH